MFALKVTQPFAAYGVGDTIDDKEAMKAAMATNPAYVVRVNLPDPEPDGGKASEAKTSAKAT